ncbi:hypothetical protein FQR65_LT18581 [Abscondita terminalis]|nr:hypothetical protein FQR65_LT18581 [Abscondita terminalis]
MIHWTLLVLVSILSLSKSCEVLRNTQYGPICGTIKKSRRVNSSAQYYYFTGIPYARPPIASLRFQEAQPPQPWIHPRNTTIQGNICTQLSNTFTGDQVLGSEDCLTLEVSVPLINTDMLLPVMVWIHGGSFLFSSYTETGPDYFMEKSVIVVAINYRLNVFGFLSTLNQDAPGNMGLKDQSMALVWVKNNIANFGGDPNRVTIFGASAGGASVQFHMLSPRSAGLFNRGISESGVTLNTWVFQRDPRLMTFRLGRGLGILTNNTRTLIQVLQRVSPDVLIKAAFNTSIMGFYLLYDEVPFSPSIENPDAQAFISASPYELLKTGRFDKVPYMIGHNTEEGSFPYEYIDDGFIDINIYEKNPALFIPISMNIPSNSTCINYTVNQIKKHFFKNTSFTDKFMGQDVRGIMKSTELVCKRRGVNLFYYIYSYAGTNALSYIGGAGHYSEVLKLFYPQNPKWSTNLTETDRIVQLHLLNLWTTFAATGNPTSSDHKVQWPNFCNSEYYLDINTKLRLKSRPDRDITMKYLTVFVLISILPIFKACEVLRQTQYGPICGAIARSRLANSSTQFYYFTGVPYAHPPVGNLRFKEAQPPELWVLPKDATKQGNPCVQISDSFMGNDVIGNEDCLTLEIAVPLNTTKNPMNLLPVMVWIHGGAFLFSSYKDTGPDYFMDKSVVIVSVNYRLNVFGFLNTLNKDAPGNVGLKDQTAALIWVKNNIQNFGGDPNKVTIFGGSAGGASVQFHLLSPRSKGLFQRAISQSGTTLNTWVFQRNPKEMAFRLGRGLGFNGTNTSELIEALQQVSPDILLRAGFNPTIMGPYLPIDEQPFIPSIEQNDTHSFLSARAYEELESGSFTKVPYMIGQVTEEGSFPYEYIDPGFININIFEENPALFVPISMNIPNESPCINYTINEIKENFFKNTSFTDKTNWIKFMGQDVRSFRKSAELICKNQRKNVFYYIYSHVGTNPLSYAGGAGHYSEVLKLFYPIHKDWSTNLTESDRIVQEHLLNLWTNFATFGHPTMSEGKVATSNIQWPNFCEREEYLNIGTQLLLETSPEREVYEFWERVFGKCGVKPYNTY